MAALGWLDTLAYLRAITQPAASQLPMSLLFELASAQPRPQQVPAVAERPMAVAPAPRPKQQGKVNTKARQMMRALQAAGFSVINEYEHPFPWSTGPHLHVEWADRGRDRTKVAQLLERIGSENKLGVRVGGWGTGPPHRGRGHKEKRALDITVW